MVVSDRSRRLLWGRAAGRCAICFKIVFYGQESGRQTVLGEEAHIVARSAQGPRGDDKYPHDIDDYENLVLLCRDHHKVVDDAPGDWPVSRLLELKEQHEKRVDDALEDGIKITRDGAKESRRFRPLLTGRDVWDVVVSSHAYNFGYPVDATEEEQDYFAEVFDLLKDWGEVSDELHSFTEIRDAQKSLSTVLDELTSRGLALIGCRVPFTISGGVGPPSRWYQADAYITRWELLLGALAENVAQSGEPQSEQERSG